MVYRVGILYILYFEILSSMENKYYDYDVVIIGCGSSGIGAGFELLNKSNLTFRILEARNRIGGRAFTDRTTLKYPFDAGAQWIHDFDLHNPLYPIYEELKTNLDNDHYIQLFHPTTIVCYDSNGSEVSPDICIQAQTTVNRLFSQISTMNTVADTSIKDAIVNEYNKLTDNEHKRIVDAMLVALEELFAADLDQLSAKQYLNDPNWSIENESENNFVLENGYGHLLECLANHYHLPILLNTVVTAIDTQFDDNMVQIVTIDKKVILAKYVIITVPLGCLKERTINFRPSLPEWKLNAIDELGFGDTDKIILQFNATFWNRTSTILYFIDSFYPFAVCDPEKHVLSFMIGGRRAKEMENENDEIIIDRILRMLKRAFPQQDYQLESYIITRWTQDKFSRGSYFYFKINSNEQTIQLLAKECAENRLFWAGEHTTSGASVHTAFFTGQREARKIIEAHLRNTEKKHAVYKVNPIKNKCSNVN